MCDGGTALYGGSVIVSSVIISSEIVVGVVLILVTSDALTPVVAVSSVSLELLL